MARVKISEWKAKNLLAKTLNISYLGVSTVTPEINVKKQDAKKTYVIKVDEGIKKRMKQGLVSLNKKPAEISGEIRKLQKRGYTHVLVEPFILHEQSSEKYLSLERVREGILALYSKKGGIDIEDNQASLQKKIIASPRDAEKIAQVLGLEKSVFQTLLKAFDQYYFSFLEINPLVVENGKYYFLDIAAEVDSSAEFFVHTAWTLDDIRTGGMQKKTGAEVEIDRLSQKSQASFKLDVLNPNGSIFMLLSGGGASIVLADEVYNLGFGEQLANYGEYSGNPNSEEVYLYTKNLLALLIKSTASKKMLLIGGGVANFTDVRITFQGIIKAINEVSAVLQKQQVKVFVRRGGPNQEEGLALMEKFLQKNNLLGMVKDQKTTLPEVVAATLAELKK